MLEPQRGDVILRGSLADGFVVLDAISRRRLAGPVALADALAAAKVHGAYAVWHDVVDEGGRSRGPLMRVPLAP